MNFKEQIKNKFSRQKQLIEEVNKKVLDNPIRWEEISKLHKEIQDLLKEQQLLINRRQQIEKIRTKIGR